MANTVNFKTMSSDSYKTVNSFVISRYSEAMEDVRHKEANKKIKEQREVLLKDRDEKLAMGYSVDDASAMVSLLDIEKKQNKEDEKHRAIIAPLKASMEEAYRLIPYKLFPAYKDKFEGKNSNFVDAVQEFLENLGITCDKQGVVRKTAERIALMMGARVSTSKTLLKDGSFVSTMKESQFNKLFMSGFCDTLAKSGFKFEIPTTETTEAK